MDTEFILIALVPYLQKQSTSITIGCIKYIPKEYFAPIFAIVDNILPLYSCNHLLVLNLGHSPLYRHFCKCLYIEMLKISLVY